MRAAPSLIAALALCGLTAPSQDLVLPHSLQVQLIQAPQTCREIRFARGAFSATLHGAAPVEGNVCYTLGVRAGQRVRVQVRGAQNSGATIPGVADMSTDIRFTTTRSAYVIEVWQLFPSLEPDPFTLFVEVR